MLALVGLEMATSLIRCSRLKDVWKTEPFCGHHDFVAMMGHDRFGHIHTNLQLVPSGTDHKVHDNDPLWGCRSLMTHFLHNCSSIAVPTGANVLDENSMRTKACMLARCYNFKKGQVCCLFLCSSFPLTSLPLHTLQ